MRRQHKFAGTGLGLDTALSAADVRRICLAAAPQATGTVWQGLHKIQLVHDSDAGLLFEMPALIRAIKQMTFSVSITESDGRTRVLTTIHNYMTTRPTAVGIPVGPTTMVGHHVYVEFLELILRTIKEADPTVVSRLELAADRRARIPSPPRTAPMPELSPTPPPPAVEPPPLEPPSTEAQPPMGALESSPADVPVAEATMIVERRPRSASWSLVTEDGVEIPITTRTIVGRDPSVVSSDDALATVGANDPTVSASHLLAEVREGQLIVTDLGSSNGTVTVAADGTERPCPAAEAVSVADDMTIELGTFALTARKRSRSQP